MPVIFEPEIRKNAVLDVAFKMAIAARTAPKARGKDYLEMAIVHGPQKSLIAKKMQKIGKRSGSAFFLRDAGNVEKAEALFIIGTRIASAGLKICGMCGFSNCENKNKHPQVPCVFNTGDLGIAVGSAVTVAMENRVDNRVMYTVGQAVLDLKMLGKDVHIAFGIPLSVSSKSPFFDRDPV
jgi:uncharacterized ferredoxin-like protein